MSSRNIPVAGEFYRHFKGNLYQILGIAKNSETMEQMVVYQALYGDYALYTRPLDMFLSPVDKEKYPESKQEYRFEKVLPERCMDKEADVITEDNICDEKQEKIELTEVVVEKNDNDEETVRPEILRFLDAEGTAEKLEVLRAIKVDMDEQLMTTIELSLDLLPDDKETLERRYEFVERTLEQKIRFEGGRLR